MMRPHLLLLIALSLLAVPAAEARHVIFVDNSRTEEGIGSFERPYRKLATAQSVAGFTDVIYVAEGNAPYDESITLKKGQLLIGAAFGLEAVRTELKTELDAPIVVAVQGPGPTIHGTITIAGDNVVAGLTSVADRASGLVAASPDGPLTIRNVWFRTSRDAFAIVLQEARAAVTISGGGLVAAERGSGITIYGGAGTISFERFPISGDFSNAVSLSGRTGGAIKFSKGSPIKISDAARDAITVSRVVGDVVFDDPISVVTHGGRGLVIENSKKVVVASGSKISTTNAAAVNIFNSTVDIVLESASAAALPPGRLAEGIGINAIHGRFVVRGIEKERGATGGTIRDAQAYGIRVEQSSGVRIANVQVIESGAVAGKLQCPEDLGAGADVVCRGGLFLRHVRASQFENIVVDGGSRNGLVANNVGDLELRGLDLRRSGALLQELIGSVAFRECSFADGGGVVIEQRFNRARLTFDHCTFAAAAQPMASPFLLRARTTGMSTLWLELTNADLHDTAGAAIDAVAADTSSFSLTISNASFQHLGGTVLTAAAKQASHAAIEIHGARVVAPGSRDPLMQIAIEDEAAGCVDISDNVLTTDPATVAARIIANSAKVRLSIANRQPTMRVEAPPGVITSAASCRPVTP